jgi:hypothetical protein
VSYATIDDLRSQLGGAPQITPAYAAKMMHPVPQTKEVDRAKFILLHCKGKRVLEFGASGPLHDLIVKVAAECIGVDRQASAGVLGFDLDDTGQPLPAVPFTPELLVCGEVLEHLTNPGWFLTRLHRKFPGVPLILSVPNAFGKTGSLWIAKGIENINADHVAWYSPKTIANLLERAGYTVGGLYWYEGNGPTANGLVVVTE